MPKISGYKGRYAPRSSSGNISSSDARTSRLANDPTGHRSVLEMLASLDSPERRQAMQLARDSAAARAAAELKERLAHIPRYKPSPPGLPRSGVTISTTGLFKTQKAIGAILGSINRLGNAIDLAEMVIQAQTADYVPDPGSGWYMTSESPYYMNTYGADSQSRADPAIPYWGFFPPGGNTSGTYYSNYEMLGSPTEPGDETLAIGRGWPDGDGNPVAMSWGRVYIREVPAANPTGSVRFQPATPGLINLPGIFPNLPPLFSGIFPELKPINQPIGVDLQLPYAALPGIANSNWPQGRSFTNANPSPHSGAMPSPDTEVRFPPPAGGPPTVIETKHNWNPPGPNRKEQKVKMNGGSALLRAIGALTETRDAINAVYDALPKDVKTADWVKNAPKGQKGAIPEVSMKGKLETLYKNFSKIDPVQAVANLAINAAEDAVIGRMSQRTQKNLNNSGYNSALGYGSGPAL